jgi:hypothetical protein
MQGERMLGCVVTSTYSCCCTWGEDVGLCCNQYLKLLLYAGGEDVGLCCNQYLKLLLYAGGEDVGLCCNQYLKLLLYRGRGCWAVL